MSIFFRSSPNFLISFALLFIACSESNKEVPKQNKKIPSEINKEESSSKIKMNKKEIENNKSINDKNTVAFLTAYGEKNKENTVLLKTRLGNIKIKLYEETPIHRANFIFLTKEGYFDTTCFYRVVPDFIIQAGDSENLTTQKYRNSYNNYTLAAEFHSNLKHNYGAVAAARDWENNPLKKSTAFEFYIIQNKQGGHHLDGEHTVFGQVISGFETIDKIANLKAGEDEWPLLDVFIKAEVLP